MLSKLIPRSRATCSSTLPRSSNEAPLFALSLLRLLSQNRIAEFHTLLETLGENKADVLESGEVSWVLQVRFGRGFSLSVLQTRPNLEGESD